MNHLVAAVLVSLVVVSCSRESAHTPPPPSTKPCEQMHRAECLKSTHCTMDHLASSSYRCRPDKGACEEGIQQTDKAACEAVSGCKHDPGSCYCPFPGYGATQVEDPPDRGGAACGCGGGPPPTCKPSA